MAIEFKISTGEISLDNACLGIGYSGDQQHYNQAQYCNLHAQGPIPPGKYSILAPIDDSKMGPFALALVACSGTDTMGRGGFFLHGDNSAINHTASEGCIITDRSTREAIWSEVSNAFLAVDKLLTVVI